MRRRRTVHYGAKVNERGQVSALCFDPPKPIWLSRATWTLAETTVTCERCKRLLLARAIAKMASR
jgi:hypothetical protein